MPYLRRVVDGGGGVAEGEGSSVGFTPARTLGLQGVDELDETAIDPLAGGTHLSTCKSNGTTYIREGPKLDQQTTLKLVVVARLLCCDLLPQ